MALMALQFTDVPVQVTLLLGNSRTRAIGSLAQLQNGRGRRLFLIRMLVDWRLFLIRMLVHSSFPGLRACAWKMESPMAAH